MSLPRLDIRESGRVQFKVFSGLDMRDKVSDSALTEMKNMSPRAIPSLMPREARRHIADAPGATELCAPGYTGGELSAFTGVRGAVFYYNGEAAGGVPLTEGRKSIADFNGKICIFPDKVYYDYLPDPDTGAVTGSLVPMEKELSVTGARFYSSYDEITGEYSAYIRRSGAGFDRVFSVGDSITISGCSDSANNTASVQSRRDYAQADTIISAVADKVSNGQLDLLLYNKRGERVRFVNLTESGAVTLKRSIPDMDNICVHNNRLWGTAASGEYIYASKLGDCTDFNSFQGLFDDSWYSFVGTGGGFTGIRSYRTAVVAFKRNCIHHIYGDSPVNFSIPKHTVGGCIDGRSICELGGVLYYLADDGFSAYSGGEPYRISEQLKSRYTACAAGSDDRHYYASAEREDGSREVLVYAPEFNVWVREDDTPFTGFCRYNGGLYGIADGVMWRMNGGDGNVDWSVVSKRFTYDLIGHKGLSAMWLRMDIDEAAEVRASVALDGGGFKECAVIRGGGFSVYRVPIRFGKCNSFRVRLEGTGRAVIHDIEITTHNGGRSYG